MNIFCTIIPPSSHLSWLIFNGIFLCSTQANIVDSSSDPTLPIHNVLLLTYTVRLAA